MSAATIDAYHFAANDSVECDLVVRNAYVVTMDGQRHKYPVGAVAITGTNIVGVGVDEEIARRFRPRRVIDAKGGMVTPGTIDLHYHATSHLPAKLVNLTPPPPGDISAYVTAGFLPLIDSMDADEDYASSMLAGLDMLLSGVTMFVDPGTAIEPEATADACEALGVRVSLSDPYLMDTPSPETMTLRRMPYSLDLSLRKMGTELRRNKDAGSLVRGHISIYGEGSNSLELTKAAHKCAVANDVSFNMHQSLSVDAADYDVKRFGRLPLLCWADAGVLDAHCGLVHMNVLDEAEVKPIVESGMTLIWCPMNSQYFGTRQHARMRHPSLFHQGVNVTMGLDTEKAATFGSLLNIAYLLAKDQEEDLSPEDILQMQTINGARALRIDQWLGSLEVGKRADIVIRSIDVPEARPRVHYERMQLQLAGSRSVDTVIVDGRVVVKNGRHTTMDHEAVYEAAEKAAERMLQRARQRD